MRTRPSRKVLGTVIACGIAAACNDAPAGPSGPPPPPTIAGLELTGQTTLAPGATAELTLIAVLNDGTRTDVTKTAIWAINDARFVSSLGQGRFRAVAHGEATIRVHYSSRNTSREIVVVPDGTFRVTGRVLENDGVTPVANAHIRVRGADETGPSTDADTNGNYRLYGVRPETDFVVTREGFADKEQRVRIDKHSAVNISMALTAPRLNVEGAYTVMFDWSSCTPAYRADLRQRVYGAVVTQSGAQIEVRFTEPAFAQDFLNRGNLMEGRVDSNAMYLFADRGDFSYPPYLTELLPDSYRLVTSGTAFLTQSGNRLSGRFLGLALLSRKVPQSETFHGECTAGNVSFERR
jgi:hypothetical protein